MYTQKCSFRLISHSFIMCLFLLSSMAFADTTSPANRALSFLELSAEHSVKNEQAVSETESKFTIVNTFQGTSKDAFAIRIATDKWILALHLGKLDAGPLNVEDMVLLYSKGGKLPKNKSAELEQFLGAKYSEIALFTNPGINFYSLLSLNQDNKSVHYMFNKLDIKHSGKQKLYGSMDTYHSKSDLRLSTTLASKGQLDFPSWLHLEAKQDLDLEIHCAFAFSNLFSKKPTSPLNCGSIFVKTSAEFDYGEVNLDLDLKIGLGKTSAKTVNADSGKLLSKFTDYKFILEGKVAGTNDGDLSSIGGIGLENVVLEFEQTFFSKKSAESGNLHDSLPHSVYTFGGLLKLGQSKVGLYGIFAPSVEHPWSAGLVSHIDKVTLQELTILGIDMATYGAAEALTPNLLNKIKQLPLDKLYLTNVTIAYTPETSNAAEIREDGFTFSGSLNLLEHLAGSIDVNVSEQGIRTRDSIQPFYQPGFKIKKANLNIFIPTSGEKKLAAAIINNLNFILIDMNIDIVGIEEQIKFKIGIDGFSFIFHLHLTPSLKVKLLAEAPISALKDVNKFKFEADIKTSNPDSYQTLIYKLKAGLASNDSLKAAVTAMRPSFSDLQAEIDTANSNNIQSKNDYLTAKNKAQKDLTKITAPIKKAQKFLDGKMSVYKSAHGNWIHWKHKRDGYKVYQVDKIISAESKVIYYEGKKDSTWAVVKLARKALSAVNDSINFIPVDAYPSVIEKLAIYRANQYSLAIAKGALDAAKDADNELINFVNKIPNNLDIFSITELSLGGDIKTGNSLSSTLTISGESFKFGWTVTPTINLAAPSSKALEQNLPNMINSLLPSAKYSALRQKSSFTPSSYAEYPPRVMLDYAWKPHGNTEVLTPPNWTGQFIDVAQNNNYLYALTANQIKRYSHKNKTWETFATAPENKKFRKISTNENNDVAIVNEKNELWLNGMLLPGESNHLGLDVGMNSKALWFIGLDHSLNRFDLHSSNILNIGGYSRSIDVAEDDVPLVTGRDNTIWYHKEKWKQNSGKGLDITIAQTGQIWVVGLDHALWGENNKWQRHRGNFIAVSVSQNNTTAMINENGQLEVLLKNKITAVDIGYAGTGNNSKALITDSAFNLWSYSHGKWSFLKKNIAKVDGNSKGDIWLISKQHEIFHRPTETQNWTHISGWATDISVGEDGTVVVIGHDERIFKYANNHWTPLSGKAVRVSVAPNGVPWVINSSNQIWKFNTSNNNWEQMTGKAKDIAISADNTVWVLGMDNHVWTYSRGSKSWTKINGAGKAITTDEHNLPWVVGLHNDVWQSAGEGNQ